MDWITTANGLITLIISGISLISAGVSLFLLIRTLIKTIKNNNKNENWKLVMKIADEAMISYEQSTLKGADKKTKVIEAVKAGSKAAGIDADIYLDQLSSYIDDCVKFANTFKK